MQYTADDMIKILEEHGFQFERQNGSHRMYKHPETGRCTVVPYHGKKSLKQKTVSSIFRQAGLK